MTVLQPFGLSYFQEIILPNLGEVEKKKKKACRKKGS